MKSRAVSEPMDRVKGCRRLGLLLLAAALACPVEAGAAGGSQPAADAIDEGFKFASALTVDPGDMAASQEQVVRAAASTGELARAARLAESMKGWRQAAVIADLASLHAARGERDRARELVSRASALRQALTGWPVQRVAMHVAEALARIGDLEGARKLAGEAAGADPRQYMGRGAGIMAVGYTTLGQTDEALKLLAALDADPDLDIAYWRTWGYIETARLSAESWRARAFEAAERSAAGVPDIRRAESLEALAGALSDKGLEAQARAHAEEAGKLASLISPSMPIRGRLLARVGRLQASLGKRTEAEDLLRLAASGIASTPLIEQPALHGEVAASWAELGDPDAARRSLLRALESAAGLENARPRALAVAEVMAASGRSGVALDLHVHERLEQLYQGLKAPW